MTTKRTAEERAESRYPYNIERLTWDRDAINWHERVENLKRDCFATCIREEVEPLEEWKESAIKVMSEWDKVHEALGKPGKLGESMAAASLAEVVKLQALVQELVDALDGEQYWSTWIPTHQMDDADETKCINDGNRSMAATKAAKEQGFVPTNTTQDNG